MLRSLHEVLALGHPLGLPDTRALALSLHATQIPWRNGETEAHGLFEAHGRFAGVTQGKGNEPPAGAPYDPRTEASTFSEVLVLSSLIELVTRLRI